MSRRPLLDIATEEAALNQIDRFGRIYARWSPFVFYEARKVVDCDADAEDVVQSVFFRVWRRGPPGWDLRRPQGYFRRAAHNAALSLLRLHRKGTQPRDFEQSISARQELPDETTARRERERMVRAAIRLLPPRCGQVATMISKGLTHSEIAAQLGISIKAVEKQVGRAKRLLRPRIRFLSDSPARKT